MDRARVDAIEVFLTWGAGAQASVLALGYVRPGGRFGVGEGEGCDAVVPFEALGALRWDVVTWDGPACVVAPPGARVRIDGRPAVAARIPLLEGETVDVCCAEFTIRSRLVAGEAWSPPADVERSLGLPRGLALSALAHAACFALLAWGLAQRRAADREITSEQIATMRTLLAASAERAPPDERTERIALERAARHEVASAWHAPPRRAEATPAGAPTGRETHGDVAVVAPSGSPSAHAADRAEAASFGMVGLVQSLKVDPGEPAPWKDALASLGAHEAATRAMFGDPPIGEGPGGLTLSGIGEGGGGKGAGVDLEEPAPGQPPSWSTRIDALPPVPYHDLPGRALAGPVRTRAEMLADPGLNQEAIRGVVRANAGRIQDCYRAGLKRNPALAGRVVVGFTVGEGGKVVYAKDEESDLADVSVRECIVRAFYSFGFPAPKGGAVTVKYPIVLTRGP
jgi:hypothetical protein